MHAFGGDIKRIVIKLEHILIKKISVCVLGKCSVCVGGDLLWEFGENFNKSTKTQTLIW